ncbi:MAG: FtsW/RodA/SpoVE family cell cycle protein [Phycisphaeraceae bacterium]|nr:FtsW/RodA/SpoVE family cell cycle protein [Phycisphaeraceae bacterium]
MIRTGHVVFLCALGLLTLGVVMVGSAGMEVKPVSPAAGAASGARVAGPGSVGEAVAQVVLSKPGLYMALAVLAMCSMAMLPLDRWFAGMRAVGVGGARSGRGGIGLAALGVGTLVLVGIVATAYVPGLSHTVNNSRRWIAVPGLSGLTIQPSEFAKWGLIVVLAVYGAWRAVAMRKFWKGLVPGLLAVAAVGGVIAHQDLGTGVLVVCAGSAVLLAAGARWWQFALFIPAMAAGVVALIVANPYRLTRIETFFDPYVQPRGAGYHMIQSMVAVSGGEGTGRGLGFGLQKYGYLPEDTTDFLFAIICEELGIVGAVGVIGVFIVLLWSGLTIVRRQQAPVLKLFGLGVLTTIGLQALINLAVVTGLGPTKGIALPLVSSGGTGWILTAASIGLLIAMDPEVEEAAAEEAGEHGGGPLVEVEAAPAGAPVLAGT